MKHVEEWDMTVECFAMLSTVPLTLGGEFYRALWPKVNTNGAEMREFLMKQQEELREREWKKKEEIEKRRKQEELERLEAQKNKARLEARKRRTIPESPTQSSEPSSPDLTPEKIMPPEKAMPSSTSSLTASPAVESTPPSVRKNSFFCFCMDNCSSNSHIFLLLRI